MSRVKASSPLSWFLVSLVGVIVLVVVASLQLFPRLSAGQRVVDNLQPAVAPDRIETARGGVDIVRTIIDVADPLVLESGGAASEVAPLVAFVAEQTGMSQADVVAALGDNFPHTLGLLNALPLESVQAEIPGLVAFLSDALGLSEDEVLAALAANFPALNQAIVNLGPVTTEWADVPDTPGTRFDGADVATARDVSDYFSDDVVPVLERQGERLRDIDQIPGGVDAIPILLTVIAVIVVAFGLAMAALSRGGGTPRGVGLGAWSVVTLVGLLIVGVVLGFGLYPRLSNAQLVLTDAEPVFTDARVATAVGGIDFISHGADLLDPIVLESGGAAAEVPLLVAFVADGTGLSQDEVLGALSENFPHTLGLLQALPLEAVNAEIPQLVGFLSDALGISDDEVLAALGTNFPHLAQAITALPTLVAGWDDVPGTPGPRFDGSVVDTVPQVRDFFRDDLIPAVGANQADFQELSNTWPPTYFFPPLLMVVGLLVVGYGIAMLVVVIRSGKGGAVSKSTAAVLAST